MSKTRMAEWIAILVIGIVITMIFVDLSLSLIQDNSSEDIIDISCSANECKVYSTGEGK